MKRSVSLPLVLSSFDCVQPLGLIAISFLHPLWIYEVAYVLPVQKHLQLLLQSKRVGACRLETSVLHCDVILRATTTHQSVLLLRRIDSPRTPRFPVRWFWNDTREPWRFKGCFSLLCLPASCYIYKSQTVRFDHPIKNMSDHLKDVSVLLVLWQDLFKDILVHLLASSLLKAKSLIRFS